MRDLSFYTDGAYSSKSQMGGWASVCIEDDDVIDTQQGYEPYTTNNRMELMAFLSALEVMNTIETRAKVVIYTDSAYIANCINDKWYTKWLTNGWRTADKQEVKNKDLWSRIVALYIRGAAKFGLQVVKVKSHGSDRWNNYVDLLAVKNRKRLED